MSQKRPTIRREDVLRAASNSEKLIEAGRAPKDHINIRILPTMIFAFPLNMGTWNRNVRSLCLFGVWGPWLVFAGSGSRGDHTFRGTGLGKCSYKYGFKYVPSQI